MIRSRIFTKPALAVALVIGCIAPSHAGDGGDRTWRPNPQTDHLLAQPNRRKAGTPHIERKSLHPDIPETIQTVGVIVASPLIVMHLLGSFEEYRTGGWRGSKPRPRDAPPLARWHEPR